MKCQVGGLARGNAEKSIDCRIHQRADRLPELDAGDRDQHVGGE